MRDTSPEAEEIQARIYREMTPERRCEIALEMSELAREFSFARIRQDNPGLSEDEVIQAYIRDVLLQDPLRYK